MTLSILEGGRGGGNICCIEHFWLDGFHVGQLLQSASVQKNEEKVRNIDV